MDVLRFMLRLLEVASSAAQCYCSFSGTVSNLWLALKKWQQPLHSSQCGITGPKSQAKSCLLAEARKFVFSNVWKDGIAQCPSGWRKYLAESDEKILPRGVSLLTCVRGRQSAISAKTYVLPILVNSEMDFIKGPKSVVLEMSYHLSGT
jgi:hypothetical protein